MELMRSVRLSLLIGLGALGIAWCDNNVNIIRDSDQPKAKDTTIYLKDTAAYRDTLSDSAKAAQHAVYTPDTVGGVRPSEVNTLQRRHAAKHFTAAGFGPAGFGNIDDERLAYDAYLGRFWEVNPHSAIKATGEVTTDLGKSNLFDFNLGANLYALPTDVSPYLGGSMGLAYGRGEGDHTFGFNLGASLGALLFRTASAEMNLEANAQILLSQLTNDYPTVYTARLGVLF